MTPTNIRTKYGLDDWQSERTYHRVDDSTEALIAFCPTEKGVAQGLSHKCITSLPIKDNIKACIHDTKESHVDGQSLRAKTLYKKPRPYCNIPGST